MRKFVLLVLNHQEVSFCIANCTVADNVGNTQRKVEIQFASPSYEVTSIYKYTCVIVSRVQRRLVYTAYLKLSLVPALVAILITMCVRSKNSTLFCRISAPG